jgi:hypothetical protein
MTPGPTLALMKEINAAFNSRDVDRILSFFAEDCTFLMARGPEPEGRRVHGKAAVLQDPQQGHLLEAGGAARPAVTTAMARRRAIAEATATTA